MHQLYNKPYFKQPNNHVDIVAMYIVLNYEKAP
jgi:hypothetical protein